VQTSAKYPADHMGEVPTLVIACIEGRVEGQSNMAMAGLYGSSLTAAWSFMLAARLRGMGSAYTTLHLRYEREVAALLGIRLEGLAQAALLQVAYYTGNDFAPAARIPLESVLRWDQC
jgi:hypothetical protein